MNCNQIINTFNYTNESPTNIVKLIKENVLLVGDDAGCVRLYDVRCNKLILFNDSDFEDQISGIATNGDDILISSLDGSIGQFDHRIFTNDA